VLFVILLFAFAGPSMCFGDRWHASTGVPGGQGARMVELVTYRKQLYGGWRRARTPNDDGIESCTPPSEILEFRVVIRDVSPNRVILLSAVGKPLRVDMTTKPCRVIEADDDASATVWDVEAAPNSRDSRDRPLAAQLSVECEGKRRFLSFVAVGAKPDHVIREAEGYVRELFPMTLDEKPPLLLKFQYAKSGTSSPER
jgi:hypothetical protein